MSNEVMSQDQIEKMLSDAGQIEEGEGAENAENLTVGDYLTSDEQDLLGEVGNICMGTSATTMSTLLGRKVTITTPKLTIHTIHTLANEYPAPLVVSEIKYIDGLEGDNLLILQEYDVALITNLMLGDDTEIDRDNISLTEIHMSAIGEVMNQMVGSSATALADILHKRVDISTPKTQHIKIDKNNVSETFSDKEGPFVKVSFDMEIEGLLTSEIMQVLTVDFAKSMAARVLENMQIDTAPVVEAAAPQPVQPTAAPQPEFVQVAPQPMAAQPMAAPQMQQAHAMPQMQQAQQVIHEQQNVSVQEAQFPSFNNISGSASIPALENIAMILDVPMNVTVELGRAKKKIKEILEISTGSVVVLDRPAGETVDILVNGKCIGKGEVVVIDDNYGIRVTEIHIPADASQLL